MIKQNRILKENNQGYQKYSYPSKKDKYIQTPMKPINSNINFSIIDELLLKDLIDTQNKDLLYGQVIRLAYISTNKQIHIDQEALYILQRFSSNQISFASIYGEKSSGKSLLLDKILNLAGFQGTHFCRTSQNYQKGLYFWSIPFVKNKQTKVFFIDCVGFDTQQKFSRQQQMILDLMMILSSSIIILPSPQDKKYQILPFIVKKIKQSMSRITENKVSAKRQSQYWPKNAYYLYRSTNKIDKQNQELQNIFNGYNFLIIHDAMPQELALAGIQNEDLVEIQGVPSKNTSDLYVNGLYIKQASRLVRDILDKVTTKCYYGLKYNGNICCKLLLTLIKYLNKKQKIKIDKIFYSLLKQLYESAYQYHTQFYDQRLQQYFVDDSCVSIDYLTEAFRNCRQNVLRSFNELTINEEMHLEYQEMLQKYIQEKETLIIQINRKKTKFHLKNTIKQDIQFPKNYYDKEQIRQFVESLQNLQADLDHDRCYPICDTLIQYSIHLQKKYISDALQYEKQIIESLNLQIQNKRKYLQSQKNRNMRNTILNNENQTKYKNLMVEDENLDSKTKNIKKEIQIQRKFQKQYIANKEAAKQRAEELLIYVRELQEKYRDNDKVIQQINKEFQYNPTLQLLQKRIDEKLRLIKDLQKNQSDISQLNFKRRSQVRNIQGSSNIQSPSILR